LKYRGRADITSEILKSAQDGNLKTKIMYEASLSFTQLNEYLALLEKNGMIEYVKKSKHYQTTKKGLEFLKGYSQIDSMLDPAKEMRSV